MKCPDYAGCPDFRVSTFRGSTVCIFRTFPTSELDGPFEFGKVIHLLLKLLQVCVCGDYVVAKVTTLPTDPVEGCVVSVSL